MSPNTAKMPAATPTPAPLPSLLAFSVISVLASSISSRIRSEAFSVTSWIAWPRSEVSVLLAMSVEDALEDLGDDERAPERRADQHLGALRGGRQLVDAGQAGDRGGGRRVLRLRPVTRPSPPALAGRLGVQA